MLLWQILRDINDLEPMTGLGRVMPKVSVIVPSYNHARFLRRRMDSVLQQTFQDFELILLDDCSPDDSREILSSYAGDSRVRIEFNAANSGSTFKQWNKGVGLARGEYVWIAESDDYSDARFLERLVGVLDAEPEAAFAYCRSWRVSAEDTFDGYGDYYLHYYLDFSRTLRWTTDYLASGYEECQEYFVRFNIVPNASSAVFRRAVYEQVGGADESFRLCGDWKLWGSMALTGKVAYLAEPLNYFRFHDESVRGRDGLRVVAAQESIHVVRWMRDKVTITESMREISCELLSGGWIPVVVSAHLPLERKWAILRSAMAIDPRALRRLVRGWYYTVIGNTIRVRFWHPVMDFTRPVRHALGLRQRSVRPPLKK